MIVFLERNARSFSFLVNNQASLALCVLRVFYTSLFDSVLIALRFRTICMRFNP